MSRITGKSIVLILVFMVSPVVIYLLWPSDKSRIKKLVDQTVIAFDREADI